MLAKPQEVSIMATMLMSRDSELEESEDSMLENMLKQVPEHLWPKYDFDVGLVKSAGAVRVKLEPGEALPSRRQYPLKLQADKGLNVRIKNMEICDREITQMAY